MKVYVNHLGHIRPKGYSPQKGDVAVEVSEEFLDTYYEAFDAWSAVQITLADLCCTDGTDVV